MTDSRWASRRSALTAGLLGSAVVLVFTRRSDAAAAFALALAALAGVGLLLIVGRRLRPVVGVLLGGLGAGMAVAGLSAHAFLPVIAGLLVVAAGVATVLGGAAWCDLGGRYDPRTPGREGAAAAPADAWRALDAGVDPTLDPTLDPTPDDPA